MEIDIDFSYLKEREAPKKSNEVEKTSELKDQDAAKAEVPKKAETAEKSQDKSLVTGPQIFSSDLNPVLKFPKNGVLIPYQPEQEILFTWTYTHDGSQFLFELSEDEAMTKIVYSTNVDVNFARTAPTEAGIYYWRVTDLETNQPSTVNSINVK